MMTLLDFPKIVKTRWSSEDPFLQYVVENPATGEGITTVQAGNATTVDAAVRASQKAFDTDWRWRSPSERGALLLQCATKLEENKEDLARLLSMENGKPYLDALAFDMTFLVEVFQFFGSLVDKLPSEFYDKNRYVSVVYEPFGVCAGILPWNWPPIHTGGKLAPALAAGNTMILKPAEPAPLTVIRIVEILNTVLPPDVVQVVPGLGTDVPQAIVQHPAVRMVSFTGSTMAGAAVARSAASTITPVVLELGGKNAFIVYDDADVDNAVRSALEGAFFNKGEACTAASRILVQKPLYDEFVEKLGVGVKKIRSGNGLDPNTHVGPCVTKQQQERVLSYIKKGEENGAKIAAQGALPADGHCNHGFFVPPTLFRDVTRDMIIAQDEIFGLVVTVTPFETENEAVSITNESKYGLTNVIYSRNNERCLRTARRIDVGMVFINNYFRSVLGTPFGGAKHSGYGREHCIETLREWSRANSISQPSGLGPLPSWRGVKDIFGETRADVVT